MFTLICLMWNGVTLGMGEICADLDVLFIGDMKPFKSAESSEELLMMELFLEPGLEEDGEHGAAGGKTLMAPGISSGLMAVGVSLLPESLISDS